MNEKCQNTAGSWEAETAENQNGRNDGKLMRLCVESVFEEYEDELTDPDDTPKNTLLIAVKRSDFVPASDEAKALRREYEDWVTRLTGCTAENYPEGIRT